MESKRKPPLRPDTGTYKPEPVAYTTFSKIAEIKANKKDTSSKSVSIYTNCIDIQQGY